MNTLKSMKYAVVLTMLLLFTICTAAFLPTASIAYLAKTAFTDVAAGTSTFAVSFAGGMQTTDEIEVWVNGVENTSASVVWLSGSTLQLVGYSPATGDDIEFRRVSPKTDNLVDLEAGKTIRASSLMKNFRHVLQIGQEAVDAASDMRTIADDSVDDAVQAAIEAAVSASIIDPEKHIYRVANIFTLGNTPATTYTAVYLEGHTTIGDGGQGTFIWDADSVLDDNNGTVIQVTGVATGRWIRQLNGYVTPSMFGAIGGSHDDTAVINAMFASSGGLFMIDKMYTVTRVYITNSNTTVYGKDMSCGFTQTTVGISNVNASGQYPAYGMLHVNPANYLGNPSTTNYISGIHIFGLSLVGPHPTAVPYNMYRCGVVGNNVRGVLISTCNISGFAAENVIFGGSSNYDVRDITYDNLRITGGGEVGINNAINPTIRNCTVTNSYAQNGIGVCGIGVRITGNVVSNMAGGGMTIGGSGYHGTDGYASIISDNIIFDTVGYPIFLSDDGAVTVAKKSMLVSNNIIRGSSATVGIAADFALNTSDVDIVNNTITGVSGAGFAVIAGSATYRLTGNTILGGGNQDRGVDVMGGTPTVVLNNNIIMGHSLNDIQVPVSDFIIGSNYLTGGLSTGHSVMSGSYVDSRVIVPFSSTPTIDSKLGNSYTLDVPNATAFTIHSANEKVGQTIELDIHNIHSAGITPVFSSAFNTKTLAVLPAGTRTTYKFRCIDIGNWTETGRY